MKSIRCGACGMTNWADAQTCKRCSAKLEPNSVASTNSTPKNASPERSPSTLAICRNDYIALIGFILPVIGWMAGVAGMYFGISFSSRRSGTTVASAGDTTMFLSIAISLTVVGLVILAFRLTAVKNLLADGERIYGIVNAIEFIRDRGTIDYSYCVGRERFTASTAVMRNAVTETFRPGEQIVVVVDRQNPSRSLVEDLYY